MATELLNLGKSFDGKTVLDGFSLTIEDGETVSIMGESGCGKSTLCKILAGVCRQDTGEVRGLRGKRVSIVFQEDRLIPGLSATENVMYVMRAPKAVRREKAEMLLLALGISDTDKNVLELSGGMKRRTALARALSVDFDILLLDEVFAGLDDETKAKAADFIKSRTAGKTVVSITHSEEEAAMLGGRIVRIKRPHARGVSEALS